jgi:hypothetical protein
MKTAEYTGLNQGTRRLPLDVKNDTAPVDEIASDDTDLIVHEEVPSTPDEVLEDIFKEMEEQNQDSHCESSDSDDNSDAVTTNHSRPLPSHKEALQCVSINHIFLSPPTSVQRFSTFSSVQQY